MGDNRYTALICLNGHILTDCLEISSNKNAKFCDKCSEKLISQCPECQANIPGGYPGTIGFTPILPNGCLQCGTKFPWTKEILEKSKDINISINEKHTIEQSFSKLHLVEKILKKRHANRCPFVIEDEYDVQDLFLAISQLHFENLEKEIHSENIGGYSPKVDFKIKNLKIFIEFKYVRENKDKEILQQLGTDITFYKKDDDCSLLYCLIYDPNNYMENPRLIEKKLSEKNEDFECIVMIRPNN